MMTVIEQQFMNAVIQMNRRQQDNAPDWERRRYEIAKEIFANSKAIQREKGIGDCDDKWTARYAVESADALIEELKKPRRL